jgi:hypothetical protein
VKHAKHVGHICYIAPQQPTKHTYFNTYIHAHRDQRLYLAHTNAPTASMSCIVQDPEPDCKALGLETVLGQDNEWCIVRKITITQRLAAYQRDAKFCQGSWIFTLNYSQDQKGRRGREGYITSIAKLDRTPANLASMTVESPDQHFAIWWQLCATTEELARRGKKIKDDKQQASAAKNTKPSKKGSK